MVTKVANPHPVPIRADVSPFPRVRMDLILEANRVNVVVWPGEPEQEYDPEITPYFVDYLITWLGDTPETLRSFNPKPDVELFWTLYHKSGEILMCETEEQLQERFPILARYLMDISGQKMLVVACDHYNIYISWEKMLEAMRI